jgi:hypothetical protein
MRFKHTREQRRPLAGHEPATRLTE